MPHVIRCYVHPLLWPTTFTRNRFCPSWWEVAAMSFIVWYKEKKEEITCRGNERATSVRTVLRYIKRQKMAIAGNVRPNDARTSIGLYQAKLWQLPNETADVVPYYASFGQSDSWYILRLKLLMCQGKRWSNVTPFSMMYERNILRRNPWSLMAHRGRRPTPRESMLVFGLLLHSRNCCCWLHDTHGW